jgi:hypothetical protein
MLWRHATAHHGLHQALCQTHNNRLQRTVMHKVPRHVGQRAAAEPER